MPGAVGKGPLQVIRDAVGIGISKNISRDPVFCHRLPDYFYFGLVLAHFTVGAGESRPDFAVVDPNDVPTQLAFADDALPQLPVVQLLPSILRQDPEQQRLGPNLNSSTPLLVRLVHFYSCTFPAGNRDRVVLGHVHLHLP